MAKSRFPPNYDKSRLSINECKLIKRLQDNALGKLYITDNNGNKVRYAMSTGEIRSAEILLRKKLPDLSTLTLDTGPSELPVIFNISL